MAYTPGLGVSFQPGAMNGQQSNTPVQKAVQLLSLRLPSVIGAQGIAPQALLQSPGGAGFGGGNMSPDAALELLRKLLAGQPGGLGANPLQTGGFGGFGGGAMPTPMATPLPRIIPQENPNAGTANKDVGLPPNLGNRGPGTFAGSLDQERALQNQ